MLFGMLPCAFPVPLAPLNFDPGIRFTFVRQLAELLTLIAVVLSSTSLRCSPCLSSCAASQTAKLADDTGARCA